MWICVAQRISARTRVRPAPISRLHDFSTQVKDKNSSTSRVLRRLYTVTNWPMKSLFSQSAPRNNSWAPSSLTNNYLHLKLYSLPSSSLSAFARWTLGIYFGIYQLTFILSLWPRIMQTLRWPFRSDHSNPHQWK